MPVTSLAEHVRCPIRHHLSLRLRLPEPKEGLHGDDDPERATVRGTLAHALLAEVDLAASPRERRALLLAASSRRGEDARRPGTRRVVDDVDRWIGGPAGQRRAAALRAGERRRELPFLLRLDGPPTCYLEGVVDALRVGADAVEVVDFKYASFHEGAAERDRFQLAAYALAASRAFPGRPVLATLHFLRGDGRDVDVTPTPEDLASLAAAIPREAARALSGVGASLRPEDVGRSRNRCAAEGCGWVRRCFGPPGSIPA